MNPSTGSLHLFPSSLGGSPSPNFLAPTVWEAVRTCTHFFWESEKGGRAFVKQAQHPLWPEGFTWELVNEHTKKQINYDLLAPCLEGQQVGLVSDGGLPCIADPGAEVVALAQELGIQVIPHPGPSSIYLTLMASGLNGQSFSFIGYLPIDKKERIQSIRNMEQQAQKTGTTMLFMETPYRNKALLDDLLHVLHPGTLLCLGVNIGTSEAVIKTRQVQDWKQQMPDIHKIPCVFALNKN